MIEGWIKHNVNVSIIITEELYSKVKEQADRHLYDLITDERIKFYVYPKKMNFVSFACNDYGILFRLLMKTGTYNNKQLMCCNPTARQWGKEFFERYLKDSLLLTDI
ncbi:hypothetical protein CUN85_12895 [Methanolobus halotolerans]|uniref:Methanogenesis regulatory protein FilR1 middle domain-containing protein n=1 Tax=Methanolobus halotolerans TaxID=2052935 RepID=A0A4E0PU82_9EURY|nr:transcriptional regulator FilR1 domain-containing protein [Methanolobus halotolerans]TGC06500.1 hypothetical protein CUN85_12895 [Methanolobus halotolerans]